MRRTLPLLIALALAACTVKAGPAATKPKASPAAIQASAPVPASLAPALGGAVITGRVTAPAGIISNNAGSLISNNGGSVVSDHGAGYGALALEERPLAGALVYLADAAGQPLPGLPTATAGADGSFTFRDVPPDYSFVLVTQVRTSGGEALLRGMVRSTALGATAPVSAATTLVTVAVTNGRSGLLGDVETASLLDAAAAVTGALGPADLPDLADRAAVLAKVAELQARLPALESALAKLSARLDVLEKDVASLKADVAALQAHASAAPAAMPTPSPTPTPRPSPKLAALRGEVSTLAGDGTAGNADGVGAAARFDTPKGLAFEPGGTLAVADSGNSRVRRLALATGQPATVSTLPGFTDRPVGLAADADGVLFASDSSFHLVVGGRQGDAWQTFAGSGANGDVDGLGTAAQLNTFEQLAFGPGGVLYGIDIGAMKVKQIAPDGAVKSFVGGIHIGDADGQGAAVGLNYPRGLAVAPDGALYVADTNNHKIRRVAPDGTSTTVAGSDRYHPGLVDGGRFDARFNEPRGLALDAEGNLYVADHGNHAVRKLAFDAAGKVTVSTVAGDGTEGFADGVGAAARFRGPNGLAVGPEGQIYVGDDADHRIRLIR